LEYVLYCSYLRMLLSLAIKKKNFRNSVDFYFMIYQSKQDQLQFKQTFVGFYSDNLIFSFLLFNQIRK